MTVSERIPFSGLLLPLQKGYTYVFASFNSIMVGVLTAVSYTHLTLPTIA